MLVRREIEPHLRRLAGEYPVVTVTGPRQSGKTTLCKMAFPSIDYVSLENPDDRRFAVDDPRGFLANHGQPLIIDEVQRCPELLSFIQGIVDEKRETGQYVLTGSSQFELLHSISQSLAGRTALLKLLPFTYAEAYRGTSPQINELLYRGFYPGIHDRSLNPAEAYSFYVETYLERDVRTLLNVKDRLTFEQFIRVVAGYTGRILNMTALATDIGVSVPTVKSWLSVLEASFIISFLPPHHLNFRKRLLKSPKLYLVDSGLACNLLGIANASQLATHPLRGALFETYVHGELRKLKLNQATEPRLFFFRDSAGHEVDIIDDHGANVRPIEIKSGATLKRDFFAGLDYYRGLNPSCERGLLIYGGEGNQGRTTFEVLDFRSIGRLGEREEKDGVP